MTIMSILILISHGNTNRALNTQTHRQVSQTEEVQAREMTQRQQLHRHMHTHIREDQGNWLTLFICS